MDKDFIAKIDKSPSERHFLKFVLDLSHAMSKKTVLEGVETIEEILKLHDVDYVQGFYYHKPLEVSQLNKIIPNKKLRYILT